MTLDLSDGGKHVRTRDGREVRIYATDGVGDFSIHGAFQCVADKSPSEHDAYTIAAWKIDGTCRYGDRYAENLDLIPYAPTEQWLIECPAGQTPIVLLPNSEEVHFSRIPTEVRGSGCAAGPFVTCAGCKTVHPVKVER